jgi:hypothetical protein
MPWLERLTGSRPPRRDPPAEAFAAFGAGLLRGQAGGSSLAAPFLGPLRAVLSPKEIIQAERRAQQTLPGTAR